MFAMHLLYFNPQHDIALAQGLCHSTPPKMAALFARQCAWVMAWLYGDGFVWCPDGVDDSTLTMGNDMGVRCVPVDTASGLPIDGVTCWGWDSAAAYDLAKLQVPPTLLPTDEYLYALRELQHRSTAARLMQDFISSCASPCRYAEASFAASSLAEVERYLAAHGDVIAKMPWSGSGQGIRPLARHLSDNERGWVNNTIARQRAVILEPRYAVVQDFALEYTIDDACHFVGYSLFETQGGAYKSNMLLGDEAIRDAIGRYIDLALLDEAQAFIEQWLQHTMVGCYRGPLGIDMLVYARDEGFGLHPMVEINMRHTMGLVAHELRSRYPQWDGCRYAVEFGSPQSFYPDPVAVLTPVDDNTRYRCAILPPYNEQRL